MGGETHHSFGLSVLAHGQALLFFAAYRRQAVHLITPNALFIEDVLACRMPAAAAVDARRCKAVCAFVTQPPGTQLGCAGRQQVAGLGIVHRVPHDVVDCVRHM